MKYEKTPRFDRDWRRLPEGHRRLFRSLMASFSAACDAYAHDPGAFQWPAAPRVTCIVYAPGIRQMTWSSQGPDGRAAFEFVRPDDEIAVRWRRIGSHEVYDSP